MLPIGVQFLICIKCTELISQQTLNYQARKGKELSKMNHENLGLLQSYGKTVKFEAFLTHLLLFRCYMLRTVVFNGQKLQNLRKN